MADGIASEVQGPSRWPSTVRGVGTGQVGGPDSPNHPTQTPDFIDLTGPRDRRLGGSARAGVLGV